MLRQPAAPRILWIVLSVALAAGCSKQPDVAPSLEPRLDGKSIIFPAGSAQLDGIHSKAVSLQPVPATQLNGRIIWDEDRTVRIYTAFAGRVERILVQPGDKVDRGQPLAIIASPDFGQAQAEARRAESDYGLAEKNLARMRELESHGVAARKDLQAAEADYSRSQAELERSRKKLALYGKASDSVDQTYTLSTPIPGVVVEKNINPGQELRPDQMLANVPPLFVITDPAMLWVQLDAAEKDLPLLRPGKTVFVHAPAYRE